MHKKGSLVKDSTPSVRGRESSQLTDAPCLAGHKWKMEAIGQLAGGVAHDFNNILSATLMHIGLLQQNPDLTPNVRNSLAEIETETKRAADLTRQLLLFSQRYVAKVALLELNALISDRSAVLKRLLGENIKLNFQGSNDEVWIKADSGMMEQVLLNLCTNAREASAKGGIVTVGTKLEDFEGVTTKSRPDARVGRFVCLSVADTACGMGETVLKKIFEPFFTTKGTGTGSGLGLATVYGIILKHEGWVEVESTPGKGSLFRIYLPAVNAPPNAAAFGRRAKEIKGGSETILLVEDEAAVRRPTAMCLRKLGYGVLEASNGSEAQKVWEQHRKKISLLFTDMELGGLVSGLDLAKQFRKDERLLRVIISSGYSVDLSSNSSKALSGLTYYAKPHNPASMAKVVRQCLDAG